MEIETANQVTWSKKKENKQCQHFLMLTLSYEHNLMFFLSIKKN